MYNTTPPADEIKKRLADIENEEGVTIIYACESGSRAWGFPSKNSDYDVRFIYARSTDWYLSIDVERKRDVIERPILDEFDINGWDIRKALNLLKKSNPPLLEWLNSPIVYRQNDQVTERVKALVPICYSPAACMYHHLQMARGNYREYLKGETVSVKKYFYVLRPLLSINWIEKSTAVVPMEFGVLMGALLPDGDLRTKIDELIERKKQGDELKREPRIDVISNFIESEMSRLQSVVVEDKERNSTKELLNDEFRTILTMLQTPS